MTTTLIALTECGRCTLPCERCTEPRICDRCDGSGLIEARTGLVLREIRCPGETDNDECDGGIVR